MPRHLRKDHAQPSTAASEDDAAESELFMEELRALLDAWSSSEREEVKFWAHQIYLSARKLDRKAVANASASVVGAHRLCIGSWGESRALAVLCALTGFSLAGSAPVMEQ